MAKEDYKYCVWGCGETLEILDPPKRFKVNKGFVAVLTHRCSECGTYLDTQSRPGRTRVYGDLEEHLGEPVEVIKMAANQKTRTVITHLHKAIADFEDARGTHWRRLGDR
jgi:hypothetical protein